MILVLLVAMLSQGASVAPPGGLVIDAHSRAPIAGARVLVVGYRGAEHTDAAGRFRWTAAPPPPPVTIVVILPDGRVARPIRLRSWDSTGETILTVEAAVDETVTIAGVAPGVDTAAGASSTLSPGADVDMRAAATVSQALENVPGVSAIADQGQGAVPAIRGLARGRSLLLDGSRATTERRRRAERVLSRSRRHQPRRSRRAVRVPSPTAPTPSAA